MDYRFHPATRRCVTELNAGGVIAYPTEAVWGLGCDPYNRHGVERILSLKNRSADKGLILVAANLQQIAWLLEGLTTEQLKTLEASWPGHVTWLLPHHNSLPANVYGTHPTIAVRVSAHSVVRALCESFGGPIISTSANPQTLPPARNATDVRRYFGCSGVSFAAGVVGKNAAPSVIKDLATGKTLRV
ncbi:L-threonylcarbamoyladenylate synthase [Teredinibacter haidensis]|uniref:L-threonylcarbamoyladenylate synthase n=1 Tax=Teredinibacter haidensis TaxID=2731755 RepID=UPI0009491AA4|nr:Sua5/YciO/YrdC/YwlC family protein [Teredinibacter haidensis]